MPQPTFGSRKNSEHQAAGQSCGRGDSQFMMDIAQVRYENAALSKPAALSRFNEASVCWHLRFVWALASFWSWSIPSTGIWIGYLASVDCVSRRPQVCVT
jgi:hypothetical protein